MTRPTANQNDSPDAYMSADIGQTSVLNEHGWYYRLDGDAVNRSFRDDGAFTIFGSGTVSPLALWDDVDGRGAFRFSLQVNAWTLGVNAGVVAQRGIVENISGQTQTIHIFNYADIDLCVAAGNTASGTRGRHVVTGGGCSDTVEFFARYPGNWAIARANASECGIRGGTNLDGSTPPFNTGNYSGAMQWTLTLRPGESRLVTQAITVNARACPFEVATYGGVTPGAGQVAPEIEVSDPFEGRVFSYSASGAAPNAAGAFLLSARRTDVRVLGVRILADLSAGYGVPARSDARGETAILTIPGHLLLCDLRLYLQYVSLDRNAPNRVARASAGSRVTFGRY